MKVIVGLFQTFHMLFVDYGIIQNFVYRYVNYLYLDIPVFKGTCLDKSSDSEWVQEGNWYSTEYSIESCRERCRRTNGCTAAAYLSTKTENNCYRYQGGPYTHGSGSEGTLCFPMESGILICILIL